jgi:sarcosine oxidase subunit alpha
MSAGAEEPNALFDVGSGDMREPNTRATQVRLYEGLEARSQNAWPSLRFDLQAVNDAVSPLLPAGFYYKTFLSPRGAWPLYERFIRKAAGLGRPTTHADPDDADERWAHCDVLIVGSGPAGLSAARSAVRAGLRTILCEQDFRLGGTLLSGSPTLEGLDAEDWIERTREELTASGAEVLLRSVAFGAYDHNLIAIAQRFTEPGERNTDGGPAHRIWFVRARHIVIATGAIERPLVFPNNDRPGIMLSSAVRSYVVRHRASPGRHSVFAVNNDRAWHDALCIHQADVPVRAIVDSRAGIAPPLLHAAKSLGIAVHSGSGIADTKGRFGLKSVLVRSRDGRRSDSVSADLLCVSGGFSPVVHLYGHARGKIAWNETQSMFLPSGSGLPLTCIGAACGHLGLGESLAEGHSAIVRIADEMGRVAPKRTDFGLAADAATAIEPPGAPWPGRGKAFVDIQNDVTTNDIRIATQEGYVSPEHLKRYTTLGMGTDQGKTSGVNGLAFLADTRGQSINGATLTTFRPPYSPVTMTALARGMTGPRLEPVRRTPLWPALVADSAQFVNSGLWSRARYYEKNGADLHGASIREAGEVRSAVGVTEVSTLGKFEICGADAAAFLASIYATPARNIQIGRVRYGAMLREDGFVFDDGTIWRLAETHYLVTATTAQTAAVLRHLEFYRDVVLSGLRVNIIDVSEQWAGVALAGPSSRQALEQLFPGCDLSDAALPHLGVLETHFRDRACRIARISFSGERCYEIYVPARLGPQLWSAIRATGIMPYGLEALELLRIEKGYLGVGSEINGRTTPSDLGITLSSKAAFVGKAALEREALREPGRHALVGLVSDNGQSITEGAALLSARAQKAPDGYVTSAGFGVGVGAPVALALLREGTNRYGEILDAVDFLKKSRVKVRVSPRAMFDAAGERLRA